jgi:hypothetical protein
MPVLQKAMLDRRPGVWKSWGSAPVRLYDWHLSDIYEAIDECVRTSGSWGSAVRTEVNGRTVDGTRPDYQPTDWSPVDQVAYNPRFGRVRSVAFISPEVTVHLGPRTLYAYGTGDTAAVRAALFAIERALDKAVRRPAAFLTRSWLTVLTPCVAFAVGVAAFRPWDSAARWSVLLAGAAGLVYCLCAFYVTVFHLVLVEAGRTRGEAGFWRRNKDGILGGVLATLVGGLLLSALLALGGYVDF